MYFLGIVLFVILISLKSMSLAANLIPSLEVIYGEYNEVLDDDSASKTIPKHYKLPVFQSLKLEPFKKLEDNILKSNIIQNDSNSLIITPIPFTAVVFGDYYVAPDDSITKIHVPKPIKLPVIPSFKPEVPKKLKNKALKDAIGLIQNHSRPPNFSSVKDNEDSEAEIPLVSSNQNVPLSSKIIPLKMDEDAEMYLKNLHLFLEYFSNAITFFAMAVAFCSLMLHYFYPHFYSKPDIGDTYVGFQRVDEDLEDDFRIIWENYQDRIRAFDEAHSEFYV